MKTEQRVDLTISGRVHGVGFRYSAQLKAKSLQITGFVKNQLDGSVFITAQGELDAVQKMVRWCHQGPPYAEVTNVEINIGKMEPFGDFEIRF